MHAKARLGGYTPKPPQLRMGWGCKPSPHPIATRKAATLATPATH